MTSSASSASTSKWRRRMTSKQKKAQARNWNIHQLRMLYAVGSQILYGDHREQLRAMIEVELADLEAVSEKERRTIR